MWKTIVQVLRDLNFSLGWMVYVLAVGGGLMILEAHVRSASLNGGCNNRQAGKNNIIHNIYIIQESIEQYALY